MDRYRLVSQSNRSPDPHVSSVLMAEDEVEEHLDAEAYLHELGGWTVTRGMGTVICRRGPITRVISVRKSSPMDDSVT